jgi:hypothetical protein
MNNTPILLSTGIKAGMQVVKKERTRVDGNERGDKRVDGSGRLPNSHLLINACRGAA